MNGSTASPRMACRKRFRALPCLVAALGSLLVAGCDSGSSAGVAPHPDYRAALRAAPAPLAALYAQGDRILEGGTSAYERRLRTLRGHAVVVNDWASWCEPCRQETPLFGRAAARFGKRTAFLGVDAEDSRGAARTFLRERPLPYPSFEDPDRAISQSQGPVVGYPRTAFYDAKGRLVQLKQGPYSSEAALAADIRRYGGG
jgi:cytochrome c biogenesis protein CcmG/thiol:disulfide interchange protein DsbE